MSLTFLAGAGFQWLLATILQRDEVAYHRDRVNQYVAWQWDPPNLVAYPQTGLSYAEPPFSIRPSLAVLVDAGELEYLDLVFPTVAPSSEAYRIVMDFADKHRDRIIYFEGISGFRYLSPQEKPLFLKVWFKPEARPLVERLIRELEPLSKPVSEGG